MAIVTIVYTTANRLTRSACKTDFVCGCIHKNKGTCRVTLSNKSATVFSSTVSKIFSFYDCSAVYEVRSITEMVHFSTMLFFFAPIYTYSCSSAVSCTISWITCIILPSLGQITWVYSNTFRITTSFMYTYVCIWFYVNKSKQICIYSYFVYFNLFFHTILLLFQPHIRRRLWKCEYFCFIQY